MARSLLEDLPEQAFTSATIKRMYRLVDRAKTDDVFQKLVYGLVNHSMRGRWKDYRGELNTVYGWFRKNVDYRRDPHGVELLQDVWATIDRKRGDCDDATVWLCAAAEILGCPCRIVTVSTRRDREPNQVYPEAFVGGRWLGRDATVPGAYVGWQPPQITDKRIWRRKDVGLSGDADGVIEGLGMIGNNGYGSRGDGFGTDMRPVSGRLAPGIPDDISKTWAPPATGTTLTSGRALRYAPIANLSDRTSNPRPGGGTFQPALPIESMPTPRELWSLVDRKLAPRVLDPYAAWWGKVPTSREDLNRMFPGSQAQEEKYLMDIASVPASAIAEISDDVAQQLRLGEIGQDEVQDAIGEAMEDFALGRLPRMKRPPGQRLARGWKGKKKKGGQRVSIPEQPKPLVERNYMVEGPKTNLVPAGPPGWAPAYGRRRMAGLGSLFDDAVKIATDIAKSGTVPTVDQAVDQALKLVPGATTPTSIAPKPTVTAAGVAKVGIPIGMIVALAGAAWLMTRGGKRKYRSNPRRRSRGRRGGGSFLAKNKTMILVGAAGATAWFLFLRPGATLLPRAPTAGVTVVKPPSTPSTSKLVTAAAIQAAPSIIDSISKFFAPASSITTDYSTEGAQPVPGIVTSYS